MQLWYKSLILIADDMPSNIKILTETLKDDYEIGVVTNGIEAVEFAKKRCPDLILLDIMMPDIDGYEVCSRLKHNESTKEIPIIFISALDEVRDKTKGFKMGAVDYITKPFEILEVQARVRIHLERKKAREALALQNKRLDEFSKKLSKYLSPQIYDSIFSGKKDVRLETQRRILTIFFSDIKDFTELTDRMEPEALTQVLNDYLNEMSQIVLKYGGTLDKFIGDAIVVFFGDPETKGVKKDAMSCVLMAIEMQNKMKTLRQKWTKQGVVKPLHVRIGIATGFCTVGNFGSESRLEYTIIGGQVNLASRLQEYAETDQILISEETYSQIKDEIICEKKDQIKIKGIAYPIQTYQIIRVKEDQIKQEVELKEDVERALVSIDFKKLNDSDKKRLVAALKTTIAEIESDMK